MKRALVVGGLSFIGYHLVQKLLQEDVEVYAFGPAEDEELSEIEEEKQFLIGRHASFSYHSLEEPFVEEADVIYFCLQDAVPLPVLSRYLQRALSFCETVQKHFVLVAPLQVEEREQVWETWERKLQASSLSYSVLQVPEVYGPWQPSTMTYQRLILASLQKKRIKVEEHRVDVAYAPDVATCLYELGQQRVEGMYCMRSDKENEWERGVQLLQKNTPLPPMQRVMCSVPVYPFRAQPVELGIQKQLEHVKAYQYLYESAFEK